MKRILLLTAILFSAISVISQETQDYKFELIPITKAEFQRGLAKNYNACLISDSTDNPLTDEYFDIIENNLSEETRFIAESELSCPRDLITYGGYYPGLDLHLYYIPDLHFCYAGFISSEKDSLSKESGRILYGDHIAGTYGVMSENGMWAGLRRDDCDNSLSIQIGKLHNGIMYSLARFNNDSMDICVTEYEMPVFWVNGNTLYIAAFSHNDGKDIFCYYSLEINN